MNIHSKIRMPSPHPSIHLYQITYVSSGLKVKGYMALPTGDQKRPGLLYLRGGIKSVGMVRIQRVIQWAAEGFVVIAPFYRGNKGGEGQEDFCGDDRYDAIAAFDLLKNHPQVDEHSLHIVGFSRGGVMALLTGIERAEAKSIVCWNGVSDMVLTYWERVDLRRMMKRVIGGTPNKYPDRYEWRTPLHHLEKIEGKLLIIHGVLDKHVSIDHAYRLEEACRLANKTVETWYYDSYSHQFPLPSQRKILQEAAKWMK
ncbi:dipeptidyl aminopeptidases/acylaminoacyl-peptidases [Halalkalibacter wakoensis JCM 9140]|uniref:Dipeptidyl aminopeptidases/acylaminoacyl-peptidases n=1 Tax=Halalkalibacter wakoensis JCM 9140 TaxID=1236970 RepID=W4Q812_9BACI|nr:prolyl oligopeptidase family serine peptidase [Halalkalibacter wakoensis]GAE27499.1 dipeptidyl aminopeptidases/acylaminoacyl-peptidases [Halalkalibacter wakoensis JCM 9140]